MTTSTPTHRDRPQLVFHLVLALSITSFLFVFIWTDISRLLAVLADGSGYYLQVARNAANGRGLSFDGIQPTNGYHPLWMVILVFICKLGPSNSEALYRLVALVNLGLIAFAAWLFHRGLRVLLSPFAAAGGGLVFVALALHGLSLMESALVLATTSVLFFYGTKWRLRDEYGASQALCFGLLLGLAILARLDIGFLAIGIGVADLIQIAAQRESSRPRLLRLVWIVLGASSLVLPYIAYNQWAFGGILPVSGMLESTFPHAMSHEILSRVRGLGKYSLASLLGATAYLVWYSMLRKRASDAISAPHRYLQGTVAVLAATSLVHAANELLFLRWVIYWHYVMLVPLAGLLVALVLQHFRRESVSRAARIGSMVMLLAVLLVVGRSVVRRMQGDVSNSWRARAYEVALWLRNHTKKDAVIAMGTPEITGFFSERSVIDLSGLCNTRDFQDAIHEQRLYAFLKDKRVEYLVRPHALEQLEVVDGHGDVGSGKYETAILRVASDLYGDHSDPISLRRSGEVFRSSVFRDGGRTQSAVVWRLE